MGEETTTPAATPPEPPPPPAPPDTATIDAGDELEEPKPQLYPLEIPGTWPPPGTKPVSIKRLGVYCGYLREAGEVIALEDAEADDLVLGGHAEYFDAAANEAEGGTDATANNGATAGATKQGPSDEGSGSPDASAFVCPVGCNDGKPFKHAASLAAHTKAKHPKG